jgi:hypothetical protein
MQRRVAPHTIHPPVLESTGRWIAFWRLPRYAPRVTEIWEVRTAEPSRTQLLGEVRWFGRWRCYSFFPQAGCTFEPTCLRDVADFCEGVTRARKATRKAAR